MKFQIKILTERFSKNLLFTGIIFLIISLIFFIWKDWSFNLETQINSSKIGQFGDLVGGLIGSMWALAGVILFYIALKEQRSDFVINREVLNTQAEALKQQIIEFELQRKELVETRKIYQIQSETLKTQRFESTFFSLINLHHQIVNTIDLKGSGRIEFANAPTTRELTTGRDCFVKFTTGLKNGYSKKLKESPEKDIRKLINSSYLEYFEKHQSDLGHYFRNLYHIVKFISNSEIENKKTYIGLLRAQLSNDELIMLFYNCISDLGIEKFMPMAESFKLFKNLNTNSFIHKNHVELFKKYNK